MESHINANSTLGLCSVLLLTANDLIVMFAEKVELISLFCLVKWMAPKSLRHNLHISRDSWREENLGS